MGRYVSLSGLDMSFMREPSKKKGRQKKKKLTCHLAQMEALRRKTDAIPSKRADFGAPMVMNDITPFVSPIDGKEITSRSKLKAHELRHGVKQCGDFKKGEIIAKENKRIEETRRLAQGGSLEWV
jgi:hypothetical protein